MCINIESWLETAVKNLKADFKENLLYAGLQGSYNRGEATPQSDIDLVVILEKLDFEEIKQYKNILKKMPYYEKTCGFISSREEIQNWSKEDMFQFYYDTKDLYGRLEDIITPPDNEDIKTAVKRGIENIYHACVHSYLHAEDLNSSLAELYKMTFFILQTEYFLKNGEYIKTKKELLSRLTGLDKEILEMCINKDNLSANETLDSACILLINWCKEHMKNLRVDNS